MFRSGAIDRRQALTQTTALAVGYHLGVTCPVRSESPNDKLNIASVGVGGKGWGDLLETSRDQNVVAICDVDQRRLDKAAERFPGARKYQDWRKLLEQSDIDAVTVSTPDHMHAPVAMSAMCLGKHVYCQKPLCHSVYEARKLTEAASRFGVVTQMGIQHHNNTPFRTAVKLIQNNTIGVVQAAHVWTDRPGSIWPQGIERPAGDQVAPEYLDWDLWLGVAPERPFMPQVYHPFRWRGFWDFGTGALGDMGCHGLDPVATALQLTAPTTVWSQGPRPNQETGPTHSTVHYEFPGTKFTTPAFSLTWYDGVTQAPEGLLQQPDLAKLSNGILFNGSEGDLFVAYEQLPKLLPAEKFVDLEIVEEPKINHYMQWTNACKGNGKTATPFSYSGPLTEFVLLGNVAVRSGDKLQWNARDLTLHGNAAAEKYLRRDYRRGWEVAAFS